MARKKSSQNLHQEEQVTQIEKPQETNMEDPSEKLASLKSLNALLLKETVERRQQVNALVQSKEALESEISRSWIEKQRLESEKKFFEEETIVAELEQRLTLAFVSSQLNQQAESLRNEIRRADEDMRSQTAIFKAKLEEKINEKEKARRETETKVVEQQTEIDQISEDFRRYRDEVREDLILKQKEADRLRSTVVELEKSNAEAREEIGRLQMERDEVRQEMERKYQDLKREMESAVREKEEIEAARNEQVREIGSLKKSVDALTADLSSEREVYSRVLREKDLIQQELDNHMEEIKRLTSTLLALEKNISETHEELLQLQTEHKLLREYKEKMERSLAALERDKASAERSLTQSSQQIEGLTREITELVADKKKIQNERTQQAVEITELQKEVAQLGATISNLQKQEEILQLRISELGKSNTDAREKQEQLLIEFNALVEEKKEREIVLDELLKEKFSVTESLEESLRQQEEQGRKMEEIAIEKAEIEQVKIKLEAEIFQLHEEMSKLRATASTLQESCLEHEKNNIQLQSEAIQNRDALERVTLEKDDALKLLDKEKKELSILRLKILELEKKVEETKEELAQLSTERDGLVEEKKEGGRSLQLLNEEKASLQMALSEAQQGLEDLQVKMTSTNKLSEQTLSMLKDTVNLVRGPVQDKKDGKGEAIFDAEKNNGEIRPFAAELEVIKRAFRNREAKVEYLSQQIKSLENSVMEAQKRKGFWTLLSSATTIFAAASVAYVARGR
ncbi:ELKS/Rab6-interacting/CAST family member 1-like [Macadamia integrifolia]|uniref:ELKS/Rab6-interacting/CAST family member 1-like n=1 Tax=Macadamia integrifolia TaxID=60698 RepID=UPI001C4E9C5F|nr:ELKS/Rab6-interacting/CAST family member 1-like [Macadamia integrifolia]